MTLLTLCYEFFKVGLFSVGGGLATLPFLSDMSLRHPDWFSMQMLSDMVAISESTPGPMGINMSTYVGYTVAGIPGALAATLSLVFPSLVIITVIAGFMSRFIENKYVKWVFSGVRPAVIGLISAAGFSVFRVAVFTDSEATNIIRLLSSVNPVCLCVFIVLALLTQLKYTRKLHPILYIIVGAVIGIVFKL
ncbi:MAG: chromate transporter [Clostridiales bacterium]|nr:chromate transporter [Clostridiales bacterium]